MRQRTNRSTPKKNLEPLAMNELELKSPTESIIPDSVGDVVIYRVEPNFECLALSTMSLLMGWKFPPTFSDRILEFEFPRLVLHICKEHENLYQSNIYANPMFLVNAPSCDSNFIAIAKQKREQWRKRTRQVFGKGYRFVRNHTSPILRQLTFEGVLIHERKHRFPNDWPKKSIEAYCGKR